MDSRDKKGIAKVVSSFGYAIEGFLYVCKTQRNMQIHVATSFIVLLLGAVLSITAGEWTVVLLIAGMFSLELMNTAVEKVVDLVSPEYHILAKHAKMQPRQPVLVYACFAVLIGGIIFLKYLF
ncbi:diacylglycerol kinase family protein [Bacillus megaterium]|nr:diacylglycerol kinase family protein [Priestia megaterium]